MKALVWHGKEDIRHDTVPDPEIEDDRDIIVKVTSCAICGSDLHLFHNMIPAMKPGDIVGHEMMGEVVEVGRGGRYAMAGQVPGHHIEVVAQQGGGPVPQDGGGPKGRPHHHQGLAAQGALGG